MIQLSGHFTYRRLLRFTLPSVIMILITSVYSVVDGFFVSNFVGKTPFAAVNFIMPLLMILGSAGFIFGTGGGALIAKTMGGSAYFTALNDGFTSAAISFLRTLVFQCAAVLLFPLLWQLDGIWYSTVAAEILAILVTAACFLGNRKKYQY